MLTTFPALTMVRESDPLQGGLTRQKVFGKIPTQERENRMNPKNINDPRPLVWTVSVEVPHTYCLYIDGSLVVNNCPLDEFYPLYRGAVEKMAAMDAVA